MAYIGNSPENIQRGRRSVYEFKATAGQTAFSGTDLNNQTLDLLEENEMGVYLNGIRLADSDDYSISGDTLTLLSAASLNDQLTVETQAEVANISSYTRTETDARYINYDGDIINGTLQIAGSGNNIELGDNNKVKFGGSSDLQIFHDGSNSFINEVGTGDLTIKASNNLYLMSGSSELYAKFTTDGAATLYHDNAPKIATTSTGIDVTGTVTADDIILSDANAPSITLTDTTNTVTTLIQSGNSSSTIGTTTSHGLNLVTNNADRMFIDASGNVGIGTSSPSGSGLHIKKDTSATTNELLRLSNSAGSTTDGVKLVMEVANTSGGGGEIGTVRDGGTFQPYMYFSTSASFNSSPIERMRINSSGNVGIGMSSPDMPLTVQANSGANAISMRGRSDGYSELYGTSNDGSTKYAFLQTHSAQTKLYTLASTPLLFGTNSTERMRIDSSGGLLVGKTSSSLSINGTELLANGTSLFTRSLPSGDGAGVAYFQRNTSDGNITMYYNSSTTHIGSIGTNGSTLYIGSTEGADAHLGFGNQIIRPVTSSGASRDNAIDLGYNGMRFRDLYLAGGVYLGGTGSANKLDDYEEGTWTPTFVDGTVGTNSSSGQYTKIGNTVYVNINLNVSNTTSLSGTDVGTLPFTPNQYTTMAVFPITGFQQLGAMLCSQVATTGVIQLYYVNNASGNTYQQLTNGHLNEGGTVTLRIAGSYTTNS